MSTLESSGALSSSRTSSAMLSASPVNIVAACCSNVPFRTFFDGCPDEVADDDAEADPVAVPPVERHGLNARTISITPMTAMMIHTRA